jgi:hypothetical protein
MDSISKSQPKITKISGIMKKITAWQNHFNQGDFRFESEVLYAIKKNGYLLKYEGGSGSKYGLEIGSLGLRAGSNGSKEMTKNQALEWCKKRNINVPEF